MTTRTTHSFFDENAVRKAHDLPLLPGSTNQPARARGMRTWPGAGGGPTPLTVAQRNSQRRRAASWMRFTLIT